MPEIIASVKRNKKYILLVLGVVVIGIFLRTYGYADLMRFGKDQARDAGIISKIVNGNLAWPLLGPKAGGTDFKMGPIFYYFQIISAKIFGYAPDRIAYPDLLFGILTLPVLLIFLRKYFTKTIALTLTALYSVSFFAVQNSRFAWNPNSLPLFSMLFLYALLELVEEKQKRKVTFAILGGVALGVGVQLHTLFILIMGMVFGAWGTYFLYKKSLALKHVIVVLLLALFLNFPQVISEFNTGGQNVRSFLIGIDQKAIEKNDPAENSNFLDIYWHVQSNAMFVSALGDDGKSDFLKLGDKIEDNKDGLGIVSKNLSLMLYIALSVVFSLVGYALLAYFLKKEENVSKKRFLQLIFLYAVVSFFVMLPLSHVLMLRYFLMLQFIPFIFLGLICMYLNDRYGTKGLYFAYAIIVILFCYNTYAVVVDLISFKSGKGDVGIAIWSEEKFAGEFIKSHVHQHDEVVMVYEPQNANKFIRSLAYFEDSVDAPAIPYSATPLEKKEGVQYFTLILNREGEKKAFMRRLQRDNLYEIKESAFFGRIAIYHLLLR